MEIAGYIITSILVLIINILTLSQRKRRTTEPVNAFVKDDNLPELSEAEVSRMASIITTLYEQ